MEGGGRARKGPDREVSSQSHAVGAWPMVAAMEVVERCHSQSVLTVEQTGFLLKQGRLHGFLT